MTASDLNQCLYTQLQERPGKKARYGIEWPAANRSAAQIEHQTYQHSALTIRVHQVHVVQIITRRCHDIR